MPDNDIIERLRTDREGRPPTDGEWRSFQRRAHRSVAIRRGGVALALIVLGVGGLLGGDDLLLRTSDERIDTVRSPDASPSTTDPKPAREGFEPEYWLVRDGRLTWGAAYWEAAPNERPAETMRFLLTRPAGVDLEVGDASEIPAGTQLLGLRVNDGLAEVDLSAEFAREGSEESHRMRVAQIVYTLTQFPEVESVRVLVAGEPFEGTPEPADRNDFIDLAPPIIVDRPYPNQPISSPLTVSGTADVFEANVMIRVIDRKGRELVETFTTATCGSGCRGDFSETVSYEVDEEQVGRVEVFWSSAEDGSPQDIVSLPVTLTP
ncbi:MAG: Gmad2 immunoglobulin-like domain-containing protein [Actinomycetota bacterium]